MKAAILYKLNEPLRVCDNVSIPKLRYGQVLVRLAFSGICHSQLMEVQGKRGYDKFLPHLLGHEGSGVVVKVGDGVSKVAYGEKIVLGWIRGKGIEAGGTRYLCGKEIINAGAVTTFSEYAVVSENRCIKLPRGVSMEVAALFGCAVPTGAGIVTNSIRPQAGSTIAIFGLGGVGMSALMATQLYNCERVIAIDVQANKLRYAKIFGATDIVNSLESNPIDAIMAITNDRGVDYSIEAAGQTATIEQAFSSVRISGGLCVFASHPETGKRISLDPYDLILGKRIMGSWGGASDPDRDIPALAALYRDGLLPLDKLITRKYQLEEINFALDHLKQQLVGKPLIEFGC